MKDLQPNAVPVTLQPVRQGGSRSLRLVQRSSMQGDDWLEYKNQDAYAACDKIWNTFMSEVYSRNTSVTAKIAPHRGIVQYDYS